MHLSQAVEALALRKTPGSLEMPLQGPVHGSVKLQSFAVSSREFDHFENISNALNRLNKGTYGRCIFCGARIEADVLTHAPWASECLGCADQESQP